MHHIRPSTPNTVMYDDDGGGGGRGGLSPPRQRKTVLDMNRPATGSSLAPPPPPPMIYNTPPDAASLAGSVGGGGGAVWTVQGQKLGGGAGGPDDDDDDEEEKPKSLEEETRLLLEKEFDDYYEDRVHKSAGPVVFVSKMLGMLPTILTEDDVENECKSYFNLYTFVIFIGWVSLAFVSALRAEGVSDNWPGDNSTTMADTSNPLRFLDRSSVDTYLSCTWLASLTALLFGVFKCRSFVELLFGVSEADAQLELREKHYDKIKRKSLYCLLLLLAVLAGHGAAFHTLLMDSGHFDWILYLSDVLAHTTILALDLQFLHFAIVLCKRYRLVNKVLGQVTKPWKTFRNVDHPSHTMVQNILGNRFDQLFQPVEEHDELNQLLSKDQLYGGSKLPLETLIREQAEPKITKEEENAFILKLDILRGIHSDLNHLAQELNSLVGFQILVQVITSVIFVVMFGYFFSAAMFDKEFYWPYLVLCILPAFRIYLIGHWGQQLEQQSRKPFMTICQVSTVDGTARLERQVLKLAIQMRHQCPTLTAAGYFTLGRNMILKTIGVASVFTFFMVKFQQMRDLGMIKAKAAAG